MAETNGTVLVNRGTVGMDMVPPYRVYLDGVQLAEYTSEREASAHYDRLAGRTDNTASTQSE